MRIVVAGAVVKSELVDYDGTLVRIWPELPFLNVRQTIGYQKSCSRDGGRGYNVSLVIEPGFNYDDPLDPCHSSKGRISNICKTEELGVINLLCILLRAKGPGGQDQEKTDGD